MCWSVRRTIIGIIIGTPALLPPLCPPYHLFVLPTTSLSSLPPLCPLYHLFVLPTTSLSSLPLFNVALFRPFFLHIYTSLSPPRRLRGTPWDLRDVGENRRRVFSLTSRRSQGVPRSICGGGSILRILFAWSVRKPQTKLTLHTHAVNQLLIYLCLF